MIMSLYTSEPIETNVNFKEEFAEGHRRSWIGVRKEVQRETLYSYVKVLQAGQEEEEKKKPTIRLLGDRAIKSYQ